MNENIENDRKYKLFFKVLKKNYDLHIKNDTVFLEGWCGLDFVNMSKRNKRNKLEIPNINIKGTLELTNINCNELILNNIKAEVLFLNKCQCSSLKFNNYNNTLVEAFFCSDFNDEIEGKLITIPSDIHFKNIDIKKSNHNWNILDNKFLKRLDLNSTNINNNCDFNKYSCINTIIIDNINIDKFKINNIKTLKKISYTNTIKLSEEIDISNMKNLEEIYIKIDDKSTINLKKLPKLSYIFIENSNNDVYIDLNKIKSNNLSDIRIKGYKIKDPSILYDPKIKELNISNNPSYCIKDWPMQILILLKDKTFNFYTPVKKNFFEFIKEPSNKKTSRRFLYLMESTSLMIKLIYNNLNSITQEDLSSINQRDIKGFKAISYCRTIEALKIILNHKDYYLNNDDLDLLSNDTLKSYYQKELIKSSLFTQPVKKENNRIQKKCL